MGEKGMLDGKRKRRGMKLGKGELDVKVKKE